MNETTTEKIPVDECPEVRRRAFERKARQATHQILFYLGLYYRPITLFKRKRHDRTDSVLRHDSGPVLARLKALVDGVGYRDDPAESDAWKSLRHKIEVCTGLWPYQVMDNDPLDEQGTVSRLKKLRDACANFLNDSRPKSTITVITHLLNRGQVRFFRWLAEIIIAAAALFLLFKLPQVAGLVSQAGWGALLPFVLFIIPSVAASWLGRWENRHGRQYWWDLGGQPFRSWTARSPERGFGRFAKDSRAPFALVVRIFVNIATYLLALILVFVVASFQDMIIVTVSLIMALLFVMYGVAQLLDFWDYYDPSPVRMFFLGLLFIAFLGINSFKLWLAPTVLWALTAFSLILFFVWKARKMKEKGWLEAIRTNGRGAAITLGLLLMAWLVTNITVTQFGKPWQDTNESTIERLTANDWPMSAHKSPGAQDDPVVVMAASGGGSRAAIYVACTLQMLHEDNFSHIGCNLQAISSVSGGSLANAVYITLRRGESCGPELLSQLQGKNGLIEKVAGDFLRPTIIGALRGTALGWLGKSGGRSESIEEAWRQIGLDVNLDTLAREWRKAAEANASYPPFPIPLFNSTSLETHRVVLSPLDSAVYTNPMIRESAREANLYGGLPARYPEFSCAAEDPTWVYYRDGIYGLEDLLPKFMPDLAQCVRASANFPVGFPLVKVKTTQSLFFSPSKDRRESGEKKSKNSVYLSDGGVLSNSGVWSLYHLLRNQHPKLEKRGVLVIVVDASAMPDYKEPSRIKGLFGAIKTQHPIGQSLHRRMFESLKNQYGQRIQIVQIDLVPTETTNIETTWTLSEESKGSLKEQFETRRPEFEVDLIAAWNALAVKNGESPDHYLERPPVD